MKFYLIKRKDRICLSSQTEKDLLFPLTLEQLCGELTRRKILYDQAKLESYCRAGKTEEIELGPFIEGTSTKPLLRLVVTQDLLKAYLVVIPFFRWSTPGNQGYRSADQGT